LWRLFVNCPGALRRPEHEALNLHITFFVIEDYGPSFFDANSFSFVSFSSLEHFFQNAHLISTAVVLVQKIRKFHNPIISQSSGPVNLIARLFVDACLFIFYFKYFSAGA